MLWLNVKAIDFLFQIQWAIILLDNNGLPKIYLQHSLSISKLGVVLQCTSNSTDNIIESSIQSLHLSTFYSFHMCCVDSGCFNCNLVPTIFDQSWLTADIIPLCIKFFLNRERMTFFTRVFVCLFALMYLGRHSGVFVNFIFQHRFFAPIWALLKMKTLDCWCHDHFPFGHSQLAVSKVCLPATPNQFSRGVSSILRCNYLNVCNSYSFYHHYSIFYYFLKICGSSR